jgi:hypothetical protein
MKYLGFTVNTMHSGDRVISAYLCGLLQGLCLPNFLGIYRRWIDS